LGACQDGKELFDHCFPDDNAPFEAVMLIAKARGAGISAENWLIRNKSNIESMQSEQKKETVKLYCFKSDLPGEFLTKGKIYEFDNRGRAKFDDGYRSLEYGSAKEFLERNKGWKSNLCEAVKRPAKVGEYVLITDDAIGFLRSHKGEIFQVKNITTSGSPTINLSEKYGAICMKEEYIVLHGYTPEEPKEEYWSGEIICIDDAGGAYTRGKKYTVKNGIVSQDNCTVSTIQFKSFEDINRVYTSKFIEFKGAI